LGGGGRRRSESTEHHHCARAATQCRHPDWNQEQTAKLSMMLSIIPHTGTVTKHLRTINPRGRTNAVMAIADLYTVETVQ
jgi:hypothetical protein